MSDCRLGDESFSRRQRLIRRGDFQRVFAGGRRLSTPAMRLVIKPNDLGYCRLGLAVSKRVSKRAVVRNRLKRRLREIFRRNKSRFPDSVDIVVMPQPAIAELGFCEIRELFLTLCRRYSRRPGGPRRASRR